MRPITISIMEYECASLNVVIYAMASWLLIGLLGFVSIISIRFSRLPVKKKTKPPSMVKDPPIISLNPL